MGAVVKDHEKKFSVSSLSLILGIGRERLTKAIADAGEPAGQQLTVASAFAALSLKMDREKARGRQQEAEADTAEMIAAEKQGLLMQKKDAALIWADATIEVRRVIQSQDKWESSKLLVALSKIKPSEG